MGAADISFGEFVSLQVRNKIGRRIIRSPEEPMADDSPIQRFIDNNIPWLSGIAKFVWNSGKSLVGFLSSAITSLLSISLSEAWGFFVQTKEFVMNFDWNASDSSLDAVIKNGLLGLSSQLGEFFGCGIGYISCGLPMASIIWKIDKAAAMRAIALASEEVIDELTDQLGALMRQTLYLTFRWFFIEKFKQFRKFVKWAATRDVGQIVGAPVNEAFQQADPSLITLTVTFAPFREPPFSRSRAERSSLYWRQPSLNIPFLDPAKLDWDKIKRAAGGIEGYLYGKNSARGWIGGRQIVVYGSSDEEAGTRLEALAELSTKELDRVSFGRPGRSGQRARALRGRDEPQRVYPIFCHVKVAKLIQNRDEGRATLAGNFSERRERIELWPADEPIDAKGIFGLLKAFLQQEESR